MMVKNIILISNNNYLLLLFELTPSKKMTKYPQGFIVIYTLKSLGPAGGNFSFVPSNNLPRITYLKFFYHVECWENCISVSDSVQ